MSANSNRRNFTLQALGEEAKSYDFVTPRDNKGLTNGLFASGAHLIKSCLGGGIVSIHCTYKNAGFWLAIMGNFILGFMVVHMMGVLAKSAQKVYGRAKVNSLSYPEVAEATFQISKNERLQRWSRRVRYIVDGTIIVDLFGSCCCYQVLIANQTSQLISHYLETDINIRSILLCIYIPCILICMILSLKYLSPFSIVANLIILIVAICAIVYGTQNAIAEKRMPTDMPFWSGDIKRVFMFVGGCVFSVSGIGAILPVENNMTNPKKILFVCYTGMTVAVCLVFTIGFFGYWGFNQKVTPPITTNFPMTGFNLVLKIGLPLMIYVTFALNFWIPFNLVWPYIQNCKPNNVEMKTKQRLYRAVFVTLITAISVAFPQVVALMSVIGALCLSNMGFTFPTIIEFVLKMDDPGVTVVDYVKLVCFLAFAMTLMTCGTIFGLQEIISVFAKEFKR